MLLALVSELGSALGVRFDYLRVYMSHFGVIWLHFNIMEKRETTHFDGDDGVRDLRFRLVICHFLDLIGVLDIFRFANSSLSLLISYLYASIWKSMA